MIDKKLEEIEIADLQRLIDNGVGESKTIEYKGELNTGTEGERKEFLADGSSFANAFGGDLIFGIAEDRGTNLPSEITGIQMKSEDELIRQIESMLRDSIEPRIPEVSFKAVLLHDDVYVLVIRIAQSFSAPHRVTYKGHDKFYTRNSKGKYPMDVTELRAAFNMTQKLSKTMESYMLERLRAISENQYKLLSDGLPIFVMQFLPVSAFLRKEYYGITAIKKTLSNIEANAFGLTSEKCITVDGILIYDSYLQSNTATENQSAFARFNINGIIEQATTQFFSLESGKRFISFRILLYLVIEATKQCLNFYRRLTIPTPIVLSCTILNAYGFRMPGSGFPVNGKIDRDELLIPDVVIEDLSIKPEECLKPVFDSIWNACGYERCPDYDNEGNLK